MIFSSVFVILLGEVIIRIFFPQTLCFNVSQWDLYVGFINSPNIEGYSEKIDYKMHVKINSHGLRDREFEYQKPSNTLRIGIFGDSFTFGQGVQNDETYPKYLENLFQSNNYIKSSGINIEILNFGIVATGTSHQLAFYQKEGVKYNLDMVIIGFLSGNDFEDNWNGVFYLKNNELIHNPTAYSSIRKIQTILNHLPFYKWAATHSHFVNLLRKTATIIDDRTRKQKASSLNIENQTFDDSSFFNNKIQLTSKLLEQFKNETNGNNATLLLVNLPWKNQKILSHYSHPEETPPFVKMWDRLLSTINNENINFRTHDIG